jgi:hypothetical protein
LTRLSIYAVGDWFELSNFLLLWLPYWLFYSRKFLSIGQKYFELRFWINEKNTSFQIARKSYSSSGLPDGIFSNQKSQFWYIWEGLGMENCGIFHVQYCFGIPMLWQFSIFCDRLVTLYRFGILYKRKSGNPAAASVHF